MDEILLLAIAITDTVALAVTDGDGAIIVQTAYPNDAAAGPDPFVAHLMEEAQVLLYPLPGELQAVGLVSASHTGPDASGWLGGRLRDGWKAPVVFNAGPLSASECSLERAIEMARSGSA